MAHVVSTPTPPFLALDGRAVVHQVPVWHDNFVWILVCTATGQAAIVDGPEAQPVLDYAKAHGLELGTILTTHTHPDHIGIHRELQKRGMLAGMRVVGKGGLGHVIPGLNEEVEDGASVTVGELRGQAMLTEGHLDGHICYLFGELLFSGDTLFAGGCGYFFDGPPAKMHASLARLAALDGGVKVCCAHEYTEDNLRFAWSVEPDNEALAERIREVWRVRARGEATVPSTIAMERATNPFLRWDSQTIQRSVRAAVPGVELGTAAQVVGAVRGLKDAKAYKSVGDEGLPI